MVNDTRALTRKIREDVMAPACCTIVSPAQQHPVVSRRSGGVEPDLELFHFVFSVCSQKVRCTLIEKDATYGSNEISILPPRHENYSPQYLRLRLCSDAATAKARAASFSGRSSVETEGFDPLVVPTLVDHAAGRIIADSRAICLYLCETLHSGTELIPRDLKTQVLAQLKIVDATPHPALLYGANPAGDRRPPGMRAAMPGIHRHKIEILLRNMELVGDDSVLLEAYHQKIAKEEAASKFVLDAALMNSAFEQVRQIISDLDAALSDSREQWLFGTRFTLADIFWAVSLYRLLWLGYAGLWTADRKLPRVEAYASALFERPSVRSAIIDWPGHPPSETAKHLFAA